MERRNWSHSHYLVYTAWCLIQRHPAGLNPLALWEVAEYAGPASGAAGTPFSKIKGSSSRQLLDQLSSCTEESPILCLHPPPTSAHGGKGGIAPAMHGAASLQTFTGLLLGVLYPPPVGLQLQRVRCSECWPFFHVFPKRTLVRDFFFHEKKWLWTVCRYNMTKELRCLGFLFFFPSAYCLQLPFLLADPPVLLNVSSRRKQKRS